MPQHVSREDIADRITELLIEHFSAYVEHGVALPYFQKVVRNGKIQIAGEIWRTDDERLVLYRSDVKANEEDIELLDYIYDNYFAVAGDELDLSAIQLIVNETAPEYYDLVTLRVGGDTIETTVGSLTETFYQDNLGQFVDFEKTYAPIDPDKATQILDTNIYELYPSELTKQQRINRFFREYNDLKPPPAAGDEFVTSFGAPLTDESGNDLTETFDDEAAIEYSSLYDISYAQINEEEDRYITWLSGSEDIANTGKSLQALRDDLNAYYFLQESIIPDIVDERPEYVPRSEGYLKVRTLNQAIIVRNEESSDIGLIGDDEYNPLWHDNGFTITMWVRFLDKINGGTLFNFGNPLREVDPTGFMLETFIVERSEYAGADNGASHFVENGLGFIDNGFYLRENVERFVRLVVRDSEDKVRDSHVGNPWIARIDTTQFNINGGLDLDDVSNGVSPFNYTRIPIDLREWYFIVATYNSTGIDEDSSFEEGVCIEENDFCTNPDFWRWNLDGNGYTSNSGLGAKCKVEIISRTDLLRARGFKE